MYNSFGFDGILFGFIAPLFMIVVFTLVIGGILYAIGSSIKQKRYNDQQPRLTVNAKVIGKRTKVSGHDHVHTYYYITFEVESGDRMEFKLDGNQYGQLIEGDTGQLTFQGTRYLSFQVD